MRSSLVRLGILSLLFLTFSCSSIKEFIQDGIGQPISTIIDSWGPPSRVTSDGKGGNVYTWEQWVTTGWGGAGYMRVTTYWADSNGIIYKWS
jgi:hypothetical protein